MRTTRRRSVVAWRLSLVLATLGLVVASAGPTRAEVEEGARSCDPSIEKTLGAAGAFTAFSKGSGTGDATFNPASGPEVESQGQLSWSLNEKVTQNPGPINTPSPGSMSGTASFTLTIGSRPPISFRSSCILEAGVFNSLEKEEDPFDPETSRTVKRGIEGEWRGTAFNFPTAGKTSKVVGSLATWTTQDAVAPRFKVDITTLDLTTNPPCGNEITPDAALGGPTASGGNVQINAPDQRAGRAICG